MQKTVDYFVDTQRGRKDPAPEKKALLNALQEEKIFGPSTGANSEAQAKRPQFVPFTGHFLIIEDATQVHRPPVIRQYTKEVIKRPQDYPWPFLKPTIGIRSPFGKRSMTKKMASPQPEASTPVAGSLSASPVKVQHPESYHLRASGFQPCTNTTQTNTTTTNTTTTTTTNTTRSHQEPRRLPPAESVHRLDKRMVENVQKTLHKQAIQGEREEKARKEKQQKKKKDARYCENCNMLFHHLDEVRTMD